MFVQVNEIHRIDWEETRHDVFHNQNRRFLNEPWKEKESWVSKRSHTSFTLSVGKCFGS